MSDTQTVSVSSLRGSSEDLGKGFWQQWQQYQDYLHRCCIKWMGGNPTDAEDALSRAMLKAWEKVQKYAAGEISNFKAWLTTLTRNLCVDIYRERSRGANRVEDIEGYASSEEQGLLRSEDTPEIALETGEKRIVIRRAIDNLPPRLRETFILHFYQELSYPEIAQQQEISYQNVCKRISQARAILREELRGYFIEEEATDKDKSVSSTATESAIGEMSQGNGGVEAIVGETVTLSVAVEEVESVGGEEAIEVERDVQQSESVMAAATNDGKLEVKRDGCRHVEAVLGEVSPLSSRRVLYPFYGAGLNPKIQKLTLAIVLYTEQGLIEKEKVKTMNPMSVNQESLPSFFRDVEIVGPAHLELPKYRAYHANAGISSSPKQGEVSAESTPILLANKAVKEIYQSNDFAKIKKLEANAQKDLQAVYDNVAQNKEKAWTKVEKDGKQFYMSWSQTGSMWAYTESNSLAKDGTYQAVVQVGTYSKSSQIIGIQTYNLTLSTFLVESVIAYIVARAVSSIIADGLGFLFTRFALYLAEAAAEAGLEAFAFNISATALSTVATCLVFAIVFIGLAYLWNWLNRKYTIRLQIFNWDDINSWKATGQYLSNAKICGDNQNLDFTLPKMVKPGEVVVPPGFEPVETLDSVCYYAVIVWENDNTFMEGCSMAIGMQKNETSEGFMWAFDCPRFSNNQQAGDDGLKDPKVYRQEGHWNKNPLGFQIQSTSAKIPVSFALDALMDASDGLYNIHMHINKNKPLNEV